jgi:hypothetical protein
MEYLLGRGWVKGSTLPQTTMISSLLKKGWIEQQLQAPNEFFYRMTEVGLKALKAPVPMVRRKAKAK